MTGQPDGARRTLARLVWPIYAPVLLEAIGASALLPLIPLIALELGFSVPAAAGLTVVSGAVGVLGPIPAGWVMTAVGERLSMITTGIGLVLSALAGFAVVSHAMAVGATGGHRVGFFLALLATAICEQVWMLGRQAYMGTQLPVAVRARGMSTLGGMIRIGHVLGPVAGAAVVLVLHEGWVFALAALTAAVATVLVIVNLVPSDRAPSRTPLRQQAREPIPDTPSPYAPGRPAITTMLLAGIGVIPLAISRTNRPLILPLLGAALGLDAATISLIFAVAAAVEIFMFVPGGTLMDRRGRTAVIVPALFVCGFGYVLLAVLAVTVGQSSRTGAVAAVGVSAICVALGNGLSSGIVMTLGIDLSPEQHRTRHIARWNTITSVGRLAGPAMVSLITVAAPIAVAGLVTGVLCVAGGGWLWRFLPGVTPEANRA
ncbi:MFS transporter [Tessaracoccus sp. OS52]|uniref:MFS transporter n=1 Tax=Tessaracoccus sp. OS52 TaxID=2886691 RepID=UPI001D124002|nr:MFS transporter [Tessaracoccus sp. OS52]